MVSASRSTSGTCSIFPRLSALILAACLVAAGCTRKAGTDASEEYHGSFAEGAVLRLTGGSLAPLAAGNAPAGPGLPAGIATAVSVAAGLEPRSAVLAINRTGLLLLEIDPVRRLFRVGRLGSGDEFAGRSVGGLFRQGGRLYCLLYRDPLFETLPARVPPSALLVVDPKARVPELRLTDLGLGSEAGALFALYPRSDGSWMFQLRRDIPEGFESSFHSYEPESGAVRPVARSDFEAALTPRPLSTAPESLKRAALALAPEGYPVMVSVSLPDGSRAAFAFGVGNSADTVELRGAVTEDGAALVSWNAVAAVARSGAESAFHLPVPVPGAVYRDALPLEGALLAIWEVGNFPDIEDSGIVLLPVP